MIQTFLDWLPVVLGIATAVAILVTPILYLFRSTRLLAAANLLWCSYIVGAILWIYSIAITYGKWGIFGVLLGLSVVFIGVFPMACLALMLAGQWEWLFQFIIMFILTYGSRALALWIDARESAVPKPRVR